MQRFLILGLVFVGMLALSGVGRAMPILRSSKAGPPSSAIDNAALIGKPLGQSLMLLQRNGPTRRLLKALQRRGTLPFVPAHGSGRVSGVIEIGWNARSIGAFLSYLPSNRNFGASRFVFDPHQRILVVGEPRATGKEKWKPLEADGSPHEQLAQVIGAFVMQDGRIAYPVAAGGLLRRGPDGQLITMEKSPNLGANWNPKVRRDFARFISKLTGLPHEHHDGQ